MENKISYNDALTYVLTNDATRATLPSDITDKLFKLLESVNKKNSRKSGTLTETQRENLVLGNEILGFLKERGCTSNKALCNEFAITSQKLSPIMKKLVDDGVVVKTYEKKVPYFTAI